MISIKPKTYHEISMLSQCLFARYYRYISDEEINSMYMHLSKRPYNAVEVTPKAIFLLNASGVIEKELKAASDVILKNFSEIHIDGQYFSVDGYCTGKKITNEEW